MQEEKLSAKETCKAILEAFGICFKVILIMARHLAVIFLIGAGLLFLLFLLPFLFPADETIYRTFNQKQTAEMEKIFGITVTDEVQLSRYYTDDDWLDDYTCLDIIVPDYEKFIRQNLPDTVSDFKTYDGMGMKASFEYITNEDYTVSVIVYQSPEENGYSISFSIEHYFFD